MPWQLKKTDGTTYGPVSLEELQQWAADGRVQPDDFVSGPEPGWKSAPSVPALFMEWTVELGAGQSAGPLHPLALLSLVRDGSLPGDVTVQHTGHEKKGPLLPTLMTHLHACLRGPAAVQPPAAPIPPPAPLPPPGPSPREIELERQAAALAAQVKDLSARQATAATRQRELEAQLNEARAAAATPPPAPPAPVSPRTGDADASGLLASYTDVSRNYERLFEQLRAKSAELLKMEKARTEEQVASTERMAHAEQAAQQARDEAAEARRKLADVEKAHLDIVKAYRDLNDRYIHLRQQQTEPVTPTRSDPPRVRLV